MLTDEQINELFQAMRQSSQVMRQVFQTELKKIGLTVPQGRILKILFTKGSLSLVEISKEMECSMSTLSGIIDRLERLDLVKRNRDQSDRRVVHIELSEKSKKMQDDFPKMAKFFHKYTDSMNEIDVINLTKQLQQFTQSMEEGLKKWNKP